MYHISDIHIKDSTYEDILYAAKILDSAMPDNSILVICGDVFESKVRLSQYDIECFNKFINIFSRHRIYIIPGNHDYNINRGDLDLITPLIKSDRVKCLSSSGCYIVDDSIGFSVFSPIDGRIPGKNSKINIALVHEPVRGAKFYSGTIQSEARLTVEMLREYSIAMLGDIHLPQFLAPNVAYCGSFVQKNIGEGLEHGYIHWDIGSCTGKFIPIPPYSSFVRITIENNISKIYDMPYSIDNLPKNIKYLVIYHRGTEKAALDTVVSEVSKFRIPDRIVNKNVSSITAKENIGGQLSQVGILREYLETAKIPEEQIIKIIELHNKYQTEVKKPIGKWRLDYLQWNNMFCYGGGNFINFRELYGITLLHGRNKTGKSVVLDVLMLMLFNYQIRGNRKDIVNRKQKTATAVCGFSIGDDKYVITRSWSSAKHTEHSLTCNGVNITKSKVADTYTYLASIIGTYKDFMNITASIQNNIPFVDSTPLDRVNVLTRLLELDTLKDIEDQIKSECRSINLTIKNIQLPESGLDTMEREIHNIISKIQETEGVIEKSKSELDILSHRRFELESKKIAPKNLEEDIRALNADISNATVKFREINVEPIQLKQLTALVCEKPSEIITLSSEDITKIKEENQKYRELINTLTKTTGVRRRKIPIADMKKIIETPPTDTVESLERKLQIVPAYTDETHIHPRDISTISEEIASAEKEIELYRTKIAGDIKINPLCECCIYNSSIVDRQAKSKLEIAEARYRELNTELDTARRLEILKANKEILEKIDRVKLYQDCVHDLNACKIEIYKKRILLGEDRLRLHNQNEKWRLYQNMHAKYKQFEEKQKLAYYIDKKTGELDALEKIREDTVAEDMREYLITERNSLSEQIDRHKYIIKTSQEQLTKLHIDKTKLEKNIEYFRAQEKIKSQLEEKKTLYDLYLSALSPKSGIPYFALSKSCKTLLDRTNAILRNITDFTVDFEFDHSKFIINLITDTQISAEMGSGFQKFVLDIAMRIALSKINLYLPDILIIDEGFGCMDTEHLEKTRSMFDKIKAEYDWILIATHIEEMQSMGDTSLIIRRDSSYSSLIYGAPITTTEVEQKNPIIITPGGFECSACKKIYKKGIVKKHLTTIGHRTNYLKWLNNA